MKNLVLSLIERYKSARNSRQAIAELNALSDLELRDIGLNRGDIPYCVIKPRKQFIH